MGWEMNESTMHTSKFRPVIMAGIPWQIGQQSQQGTRRDLADMSESAVKELGLFREFIAFVNDTPPP